MDKKIKDCDWEYLSGLETIREPKQGMPRLLDLLNWMAEPGNEKIWILLDIKVSYSSDLCCLKHVRKMSVNAAQVDDKPADLVGAIATTIASAPSTVSWADRIVLGCWNVSVIAFLS